MTPPEHTPAGVVELSSDSASLPVGESTRLTASVRTESGVPIEREVRWTTSDESVVTLSEPGLVEAVGPGTASVTASAGPASARAGIHVPPPDGTADGGGGPIRDESGDVALHLQEGAIEEETSITIVRADPALLPSGSAEEGYVMGTAHRFAPDGLDFSSPVTLEISYGEEQLPDSAAENLLRIHELSGGAWERVPRGSVDMDARVVRAPIDGFSVYAIFLTRNDPPRVRIDAPADGAEIEATETFDLEGRASDPEDGALGGRSLTWASDADALAAQQPDGAGGEEPEEADTPDRDGATREAVGVSGHWTLEVRNPDGTLDERVEFENDLASPETWAQVMAGTQTSGAWLIHVPDQLCADVFGTTGDGSPTSCNMHEPGTGPFEESNEDLSITVPSSGDNADDIMLSASFEADFDGSVSSVETQMNTCDPGVSPDACTGNQGSVPALTQKTLSSPVSVVAGQQVLIEVVLSFGSATLQ